MLKNAEIFADLFGEEVMLAEYSRGIKIKYVLALTDLICLLNNLVDVDPRQLSLWLKNSWQDRLYAKGDPPWIMIL